MPKKIIEKEFKKSVWEQGFSLEQNVFRVLEKDGWEILPNRNFFDSVNGLTREFDLLAYKSKTQLNITFFTILIIECKFNPHRIVFYVRPIKKESFLPQFYVGDFIKKIIQYSDIKYFFNGIKQYKYFFEDNEQVFGYQTFERVEKLEKNKATNQNTKKIFYRTRQELSEKNVFGAINTVIQATTYEEKIRDKIRNTSNFLIYFPLVIFSDNLYKACLTDRKTLKKQDTFHYRSGMAFSGEESPDEFNIHICSISKLNNLLKVFNYINKQFAASFFKKIKKSE